MADPSLLQACTLLQHMRRCKLRLGSKAESTSPSHDREELCTLHRVHTRSLSIATVPLSQFFLAVSTSHIPILA